MSAFFFTKKMEFKIKKTSTQLWSPGDMCT